MQVIWPGGRKTQVELKGQATEVIVSESGIEAVHIREYCTCRVLSCACNTRARGDIFEFPSAPISVKHIVVIKCAEINIAPTILVKIS